MIQDTITNLQSHGFDVTLAATNEEATKKVYELIPEGSQVMTMSSVTLNTLGITDEINKSGKYQAVRDILYTGEPEGKHLASLPDYAIGSVNALTETGELLIASASGSQIPAYAFGGKKVVFVVSTQKIVADLSAALKRINEVVVPQEDTRALAAYGKHTSLNKMLIIYHEPTPSRIHVVLVDQPLGF